ncbi:MAG: hypothetical protein H7245_17100 [Candidatus Saccharibacteria bacterium]|nr:hypothetical protein [Pseudorhodobacter sp.]
MPKRLYNITAGPSLPMGDIANILTRLRPEARLVLQPDSPPSGDATAIDNRRAADDLGFRRAMTLTAGLADYLGAL